MALPRKLEQILKTDHRVKDIVDNRDKHNGMIVITLKPEYWSPDQRNNVISVAKVRRAMDLLLYVEPLPEEIESGNEDIARFI